MSQASIPAATLDPLRGGFTLFNIPLLCQELFLRTLWPNLVYSGLPLTQDTMPPGSIPAMPRMELQPGYSPFPLSRCCCNFQKHHICQDNLCSTAASSIKGIVWEQIPEITMDRTNENKLSWGYVGIYTGKREKFQYRMKDVWAPNTNTTCSTNSHPSMLLPVFRGSGSFPVSQEGNPFQ